jgi:hypothetical protein
VRLPRWWLPAAALLAGAGVAIGVVAWLAGGGEEAAGPPRAAIVDQLSLTVDNPDFRSDATELLEGAGYAVDYFPGAEVTVDFFRRLPSRGYDLILFRNHADRLQATADDGTVVDDVMLFTSEPYDEETYVRDQAANRLVIARYHEGGEGYFGIAPSFFENASGDFDGATIIMMGCEGFLTDRTAKALVDMGAAAYISWDETVSATHTDLATTVLLRHLLVGSKRPSEAVALTMADVGPDPFFGSRLRAYAPEG